MPFDRNQKLASHTQKIFLPAGENVEIKFLRPELSQPNWLAHDLQIASQI